MSEIITPFTYTDLPAPVAAEVDAATVRIKDRLTRQVKDIIETGRDLQEVKSKLEHGQFEAWLNGEFGMAVRTAQRFMRASEWVRGKNDIVDKRVVVEVERFEDVVAGLHGKNVIDHVLTLGCADLLPVPAGQKMKHLVAVPQFLGHHPEHPKLVLVLLGSVQRDLMLLDRAKFC